MTTSTEWDYSVLAAHYDNRADYCGETLSAMLTLTGLRGGVTVADIGAGTGKLSIPLARAGLLVRAVEPNDAMRSFGIRNCEGMAVTWTEGSGEATGLPDASVSAAFFGSSFNVVDRTKALPECRRIVQPRGWLVCMWNHRVLTDTLQAEIEAVIHDRIPGYSYGSRRADPTPDLEDSNLFDVIHPLEGRFVAPIARTDFMDAWRSHATLQRQAGEDFADVLDAIEKVVPEADIFNVPYETRLWAARFAE